MDQLNETYLFPTIVYSVDKPEFLLKVETVAARYIQEKSQVLDRFVTMTADFSGEPEIEEFAQYVSQTAWNILDSQGHDMSRLVTYFQEMWVQSHSKYSGMDQHAHGAGSQISACLLPVCPRGFVFDGGLRSEAGEGHHRSADERVCDRPPATDFSPEARDARVDPGVASSQLHPKFERRLDGVCPHEPVGRAGP
jgi:hypothetical protein